MKQRRKIILAVIVIVGISILGINYFMNLTTTMDQAVLNKLDETEVTLLINRIPVNTEIPSKDVNITDQNQISNVFKQMSSLKLKKTLNIDKQDITSEYNVLIYSKDSRVLFSVAFLNEKYLYVYDKNNKETTQNYSITSDFDYNSFTDMLEQLLESH